MGPIGDRMLEKGRGVCLLKCKSIDEFHCHTVYARVL